MTNELWFLLLIFATVIFLLQSLLSSVYSPQKSNTRLLRQHLKKITAEGRVQQADLVLNQKLEKLPDLYKTLENIFFVKNVTYKLQLAGYKILGYQYIFLTLFISTVIAALVGFYTLDLQLVFFTFVIILFLFHFTLMKAMSRRLEKIEEQFPEALEVLKRGLQAGYAFSEALKLVYEETQGELSKEFYILFSQINFGTDIKTSLLIFVQRVPITSAMAFANAVIIQKETGGNLAENIDSLANVIRQRFKFKRRVKTLTAEGRLSGWVLVLTPFVLFAALYINSPDYIATLTSTPKGLDLLKWGGLGMLFGILWISKLIKIDL